MKRIGEKELRAANRAGFKSSLRRLLLVPAINRRVTAAALPLVARFPQLARIPVAAEGVTLTVEPGLRLRLAHPQRCDIAKELFWYRGRRRSPADALALSLLARLVADADLFIDVGAYTGLFSLVAAAANPRIRAVGYDLLADNVELARYNARLNRLDARVEFRHRGLGAESGVLRMPVGYEGSVLPSSLSLGSSFDRGHEVAVVTLDSELAPLAAGAACIKLDVEGYEARVLAGARKFIAGSRPDIICEILPGNPDLPGAIQDLLPAGYACFRITDRGPVRSPALFCAADARDWLLTPRPGVIAGAGAGGELPGAG